MLINSLSEPRLRAYRARCADEETAVRLYLWNHALASAFWGPIGLLEVSLRNLIHDQMKRDRPETWWDSSRVWLLESERTKLSEASRKVESRINADPCADDVVAATSFGLWVALTGEGNHRDPTYRYQSTIWNPRLEKAFENPDALTRKNFHANLVEVREWRNRVAHHEPLIGRGNRDSLEDRITAKLSTIVSCARFIHPAIADTISTHERVNEVLGQRQDAMVKGIIRF